jgi:hypothetical protein
MEITIFHSFKKLYNNYFYFVSDGKEYDVLICYDDKDSDFVLGMLVPTLETHYDYHCFTHHLGSTGGNFGTACKLTVKVLTRGRIHLCRVEQNMDFIM